MARARKGGGSSKFSFTYLMIGIGLAAVIFTVYKKVAGKPSQSTT